MLKYILKILTVVSLGSLSAMQVAAAPMYSDLWWNPNESGWGITFSQQSTTIFATWFIYGADGKPTWAVATMQSTPAAPTTFTGQVFTVVGMHYATIPFNPAATSATQAGTAGVTFQDASHATLTYTIGGNSVNKVIQRQTLVPLTLAGSYKGYSYGVSAFGSDSTTFTVTVSGNTINIARAAFFDGECRFAGTFSQAGSRVAAIGTYQCADFSSGNWTTSDLTIFDDVYLVGTIITTRLLPSAGGPFSQRFLGSK